MRVGTVAVVSVGDASVAKTAVESITMHRRVCSKSKRSKRMCHPTVDVSMAAVSLIYTVRSVFFIRGLRSSISSAVASMPGEERLRLPMKPCKRRSPIKSRVLICASLSRSSFSTMSPLNSGHSFTSTMVLRMSAMVSCSFTMRTPSTCRSRGKLISTCSTLMSMPVFFEAVDATCCTTQFCMGGT